MKRPMAGYSGTPLIRKLGIKPGHAVVILGAPEGFIETLGLPGEVEPSTTLRRRELDVVLWFPTQRAELARRFSSVAAKMKPAGAIWIAWPKATARKLHAIDSDMNENAVREVILPLRYVDNKVAAIDEIWSGLRCVLRREHRG